MDQPAIDEALAAARAGDREALGVVWRRWNAPLQRYLSVRGAAAVEDLAAEVWIEVARGLPRFDGGSDGCAIPGRFGNCERLSATRHSRQACVWS